MTVWLACTADIQAGRRDLTGLEARVLDYTLRRKPADGSTHWSSRKLAAQLGMAFMTVQRIWRKHDIRPHRLDTHMVSNDPDFETKAVDVIGLYLNPPLRAVVFCVDEKMAIQALDRKDRMLPLSPGRAESHGFEYKRNGTLSLFAALNFATGEVLGKTAPRHTSAQFVAFLTEVVSAQPRGKEIHVICDNVSSHKTDAVRTFLADHPREPCSGLGRVERFAHHAFGDQHLAASIAAEIEHARRAEIFERRHGEGVGRGSDVMDDSR
ncbi:hypothetical protein BN2475_1710004 [Paraburkholderia ribeironis]|uniref:Tc1-like transposase DDE domain-containing protein n=1 Tax=Paraburkholderia ribeironis TaxID=1247936 RepID=A0A1N7SS29_9BURK|nr:hypothetical protein BN2475_1710004 [Paraburkholderia ribeironis]